MTTTNPSRAACRQRHHGGNTLASWYEPHGVRQPRSVAARSHMVSTAFAGIGDFERSLIVERTSAGRIAAKARGVRFGPSPALSAAQIENARKLIKDEEKTVAEVARLLGVHRATLYRALADAPAEA
jgi:DNA invertase Pin-like site-specific DNA recombinase|nr:recombinase family protein [Sinorhizobium meliloti]